MKVYIIRHGLTQLNKLKKVNGEVDEPLIPEGIEQAKAVIPLLPKTIRQVYCSPMVRAKQTAEIITSKLRVLVSCIDELTEIRMGSSLAGKSWEEMEEGLELKKKHRTVQFDYRQYGGESVAEVKERLIKFLKKINNKHQDFEVLLITHGGIIRFFHLLNNGEIPYETEKHISPLTFDINKMLQDSRY